jgi:hypothetical protein
MELGLFVQVLCSGTIMVGRRGGGRKKVGEQMRWMDDGRVGLGHWAFLVRRVCLKGPRVDSQWAEGRRQWADVLRGSGP